MEVVNSVTKEQVEDVLLKSKVDTMQYGDSTTIVVCTLPNGFRIVESSSCVDPANYSQKIGEEICLERIENKIWELLGYMLMEGNYIISEIVNGPKL